MVKAIIFDLDNTLVDFSRLKQLAIRGGVKGMLEAGLEADEETVYKRIFEIYEKKGWEYQTVFDDVILEFHGQQNHKFLAAAIIAYKTQSRGIACTLSRCLRDLDRIDQKRDQAGGRIRRTRKRGLAEIMSIELPPPF